MDSIIEEAKLFHKDVKKFITYLLTRKVKTKKVTIALKRAPAYEWREI